jgi:hypothetical protein
VVLVTTLFYSALTAFYIFAPGGSIAVFSWLLALVTVPFWAGIILLLREHYSAARAVLLIGGILAVPIGAIMIIAGARLKRAGACVLQITSAAEDQIG